MLVLVSHGLFNLDAVPCTPHARKELGGHVNASRANEGGLVGGLVRVGTGGIGVGGAGEGGG